VQSHGAAATCGSTIDEDVREKRFVHFSSDLDL